VLGVGAKAYGAASDMLQRRQSAGGPDVFDELASNFAVLALVLGDVADTLYATSARDPKSVLELYQRWTRRGSHALALALVRSGAAPMGRNGLLH
jgi:hypothetical protein